jgi:PII-like signaling protein
MGQGAKLLRIYTNKAAYFGESQVFEVVATRARDAGLAGATVLQALIGFGPAVHRRERHVLEGDQPVVIEIVDTEGRLRDFAAALSDIPNIGLVTLEAVEVLWPDAIG